MPLPTGHIIGNYEVLGPAGAGGMGEVYRARDSRLERIVAVKALPAGFAESEERVARFEREARLLASLNHSNIAGIYGIEDASEGDAGGPYLVLEFVEGVTLSQKLSQGPLTVTEVVHIGAQVAAAMEAAHDKGIVHRDLKPANIMITEGDQVKVLDFGLAKDSETPGTGSSLDLTASRCPFPNDQLHMVGGL